MAIDWMDGFDHYGSGARMTEGPSAWASTSYIEILSAGRTGACMHTMTIGAYARRLFGAARAEGGIGFAMMISLIPSSDARRPVIVLADSANTGQLYLYVGVNGQVQVYRGSTLLGESDPGIFAASTWHYVEVKYLIADAGGYVIVRLDTNIVLNLTDVDTKNTANANTQSITITQGSSGGPSIYLDDMVSWDTTGSANNDFLGDVKIYTRAPTGPGDDTDWTPTSGANWQCVDETPPSDADYVSESTVNGRDLYAHSGLPAGFAGVVKAVGVVTRAWKDNAGPAAMRHAIKSGSSIGNGDNVTPTVSAAYHASIFETSPATGAAFTPSEVNSLQFGAEFLGSGE